MAEIIFIASLLFATYVYLGYPLLLMFWRRLSSRSVHKRYTTPRVSLVISMHNERENAKARIENCLALDYPRDRLQIVVSLDAPTDGTDLLLEDYSSAGIVVLQSSVRKGKAAAVNAGMAAATGEIVLFADARQSFDRNVVRELIANFADRSVGAVSGELVLLNDDGTEAASAIGVYWRYEKFIRSMESAIHSVPGVTGAIYAIRRELYKPLPPGTVLDDVLTPMRIVLRGRRSIFEPAARAYDRVERNAGREYVRKTRTLMGNYELLIEMPELLAPWRNPIFVQFVSHKVGRLLIPWCMVAMLVSNLFLFHGPYRVTLIGQVLFYALALAGTTESRGLSVIQRIAVVPHTFVLMNWAAVAGLCRFVRGHQGFWDAHASTSFRTAGEKD